MKNILLILENSLEFDLTKTVLSRLGFNVIWIQKGVDMKDKLQKNFPDLVITSILGQQDEFLDEFLSVRTKRGVPQFIWAGPAFKLDKLKPAQRKLIDAHLEHPIKPDQLIAKVCELFSLNSQEYIGLYRSMLSGSQRDHKTAKDTSKLIVTHEKEVPGTASILLQKTAKTDKYNQFLEKVEKQDKVFTTKELFKRTKPEGTGENTTELFEKKKNFIKALFKKS